MRSSFRSVALGTLWLSACREPTATTDRISAVISPFDITVQVLPTPAGWSGGATAVGGNGAIFATNNGNSAGPLMAWVPPYSALPLTLNPSAATAGYGASNELGDVAGFTTNGGGKGAWLQTAPATWSFVRHLQGAYVDVSAHAISNTREMAGYVTLAGVSGSAAFRGAYFSAPGSAPVELPLPSGGGIVGAIGESMNLAGDIVGHVNQVIGTTLNLRAVMWHRTGPSGWTPELLPVASTTAYSSAISISDAGQIAGNNGAGPARWSPNGSGGWVVEQVPVSGGTATNMDACGRVVGYGPIGGKNARAFIWDGSLTVLPLPGNATRNAAIDIAGDLASGRGAIVGWAAKGGQSPYPVRWTVPGCP